jgi:hypothetical protein
MRRHFGELAIGRLKRSFLVALQLIQIRRKRNSRSDGPQLVAVNRGQLESSLAGQALSQKVERRAVVLVRCAVFAVAFRGAHLAALIVAVQLAAQAVGTVIRTTPVLALCVIGFRL